MRVAVPGRKLVLPPIVASRVQQLGILGAYLRTLLDSAGGVIEYDASTGDVVAIKEMASSREICGLTKVAASMLCLRTPVQVKLSNDTVLALATLGGRGLPEKPTLNLDTRDDRKLFPLKGDAQAATKVNVFFRDVWADVNRHYPEQAREIRSLSGHMQGFYNDRASGVVMYAALGAAASGLPVRVFWHAAVDPEFAKALNNVLKACGAGQSRLAVLLLECVGLLGRGVGDLDLTEEAAYRCVEGCNGKVVDCDGHKLRSAIRHVMNEELGGSSQPWTAIDTSEYFSRRWLGTVNGSHNKSVHGKFGIPELPPRLKNMQLHRRVGAEVMTVDPLPAWDGSVRVGVSAKLEPGKRRALFACDTVSYMAFDCVLEQVEARWAGKRVILNPGAGGNTGICARVKAAMAGMKCAVMLDYDDFNSQHSLAAQAMVIEEACRPFECELTRKCVASFQAMDISLGGSVIGRAKGTLMSGHRATSFINSVLNAAYLRLICGEMWDRVSSLHVGDDVFVGVRTVADGERLVSQARLSNFSFNPIKQSYGTYSTEFLRMAGDGRNFRGYLARAVAAVVAGNWTNDVRLGEGDAATMYAQMGWTLVNRSGHESAGLLLGSTARRRCVGVSGSVLDDVLRGRASVSGSPVRAGHTNYQCYGVVATKTELGDKGKLKGLPDNATKQYLSTHATPVELEAVGLVGADIKRLMLEASYNKSLLSSGAAVLDYRWVNRGRWVPTGRPMAYTECMSAAKTECVLDAYPLIRLVAAGLSRRDVEYLCKLVGVQATEKDYRALRGELSSPVAVVGWMPFSDALSAARRAEACTVAAEISVAV